MDSSEEILDILKDIQKSFEKLKNVIGEPKGKNVSSQYCEECKKDLYGNRIRCWRHKSASSVYDLSSLEIKE